uniref:Uncharacterized protein n=1 Tax=uncultured organism TaxID=155900 RepID=Q1EHW8_9ZZZZ|nr:hypothetical protein 10D02-37 [uncultured organism]
MTGLGMGVSALPRTKPGDYDRALALVAGLGDDKAVKAKLTELKDAQAAHDAAREKAEGAIAESKQREAAALEAEEGARSDLAELAALKAAHDAGIRNERATLDAEGRRLDEQAKALDAEQADLNRREAAIQRAFDAYTGVTI